MHRLLATIAIVAAVALAGCGTSGGVADTTTTEPDETTTVEEQPTGDDDPMVEDYEAAVVTQFTVTEPGELTLTTEEAECVAPKWVEAMTVERLQDEGVTLEDLADTSFNPGDLEMGPEIGQEMVEAFDECEVDLFALAIASAAGADTELESCIVDNVDEDALLDLLARDIGGEETDDEFDEVFAPAEQNCEPGN